MFFNIIVTYHNITLFSDKLTTMELSDILNQWVDEYNDNIKKYKSNGKNYYFYLTQIGSNSETSNNNKNKDENIKHVQNF